MQFVASEKDVSDFLTVTHFNCPRMENFMYSIEDDIFDIDYYESSTDYSDELASTGSNESDIENVPLNQCSYMKRGPGGRKVLQRKAANMRERRRMKSINDAFDCLRKCLPVQDSVERKLSKVDTLKYAMAYISGLSDLIKSSSFLLPHTQRTDVEKAPEKVILKSQYLDNDLQTRLVGHSLSCSVEISPLNHVTSDNKLYAKVWFPQYATDADLINLASYSNDFSKHV
ncbi:pancreas transcription factor 1 subunit alpha-like [Dreissena polymorpha]|uniref:BHLH domain-containing protein n=1 Tax=Dreissena polymorpha TaxID=45954 RepID=A0A9D4HIE7_DREPO|nr:pancreas transcription factor 1 subunit alpha-like [Dreissena polymorpha]KAH3720320.1 hypothetical protein DPMN_063217 [Dreissena polymorpha]